MAEMEFRTEEGMCFAGGDTDFACANSVEEAQDMCRKNPGATIGYCYMPSNPGCVWVKKPGTTKFPDDEYITVSVVVDMNHLPTEDLFEDEYVDEWSDDTWKRPGRGEGLLDDKQICLFNEIHPCDLHQGACGDCWLISAIAALAEFPELIQKIFNTKTIDPQGHYSLNLYDFSTQQMVEIHVDDRLASHYDNVKYVSASPDGEIWPCILEKGMAAINGGYGPDGLAGYWATYGLAQMTGCLSTKSFFHEEDSDTWVVRSQSWSGNLCDGKDDIMNEETIEDIDGDTMWQKLCDFDAKNYIITCDTFGESDGNLDDAGVVGCHAYSLLQAKANVAGSGFNLLQIRNPWGTQEASLPWADDDDMWEQYPEVAAELQPQKADDGMFWIQWEDFIQHYRAIFVLEMGAKKRSLQCGGKRGRKGTTKPDNEPPVCGCVTM